MITRMNKVWFDLFPTKKKTASWRRLCNVYLSGTFDGFSSSLWFFRLQRSDWSQDTLHKHLDLYINLLEVSHNYEVYMCTLLWVSQQGIHELPLYLRTVLIQVFYNENLLPVLIVHTDKTSIPGHHYLICGGVNKFSTSAPAKF